MNKEAGFLPNSAVRAQLRCLLLLLGHGSSDPLLSADLLQDQVLDVDLVPGSQFLNEGAFPQLVARYVRTYRAIRKLHRL